MEAMACGIPCVVPRSSALAEWPEDKVLHIECHTDIPNVNTMGVNTIMDTPRLDSFIEQMERLYNDAALRKSLGTAGWKHVNKSKFDWSNIADRFNEVFEKALKRHEDMNKITIKRG